MSGSSTAQTPWYSAGLVFECTQCGNCCSGGPGYVWVSADEAESIAAHLGLSPDEFSAEHLRRVGFGRSLLEKPGGDCEFLLRTPEGRTCCTIHAVRPTQCRTWPFWKSNLASRESWERTARDCPGIGCGPAHALPVIQAALKQNGRRPL